MTHVYASLAEFKDFLREQGSASLGSNNDASMLTVLESASRRVDVFCNRGTGFGPVTAVRKYDGEYGLNLWFGADLASLTSVSIRPTTGAAGVAATVETDFYLMSGVTYGDPPYRQMVFHQQGSVSRFGYGYRVTEITGTWGYPTLTRTLVPTTAEALDNSEQAIDVSALTGISPGMTLLIESEQVYVSSMVDSTTKTLNVDRGVNGTTAAAHDTAKAISRIVYDSRVMDATMRIALRRWRARDAGADGMDGGGQVGVIVPREGEDLILERTIGSLRLWEHPF
jgi:hypothetical protein